MPQKHPPAKIARSVEPEGNLSSKSAIGFDLSPNDKYRNNTTISCTLPFSASGAIDLGGNN
jgi:hypothetical protein